MRAASRAGTPVIARGAASTAHGQAVPVLGGVVLDTSFLKRVRGLERDIPAVTVEAGIRWADLSAWLEEKGFALGSYPSSWYSTVGGWAATGGIGVNTLSFGPLRRQVLALWAASPDGRIRRLKAGSPGFDVFFETEGQLGVVLALTLKVRPAPEASIPLLVPCADARAAWEIYVGAAGSELPPRHAALWNPARLAHLNGDLGAKMDRKGSGVTRPYAEKWSVLIHVDDAQAASGLRTWLAARGAAPAPAFAARYAWEERLYPLKGKRHDELFLASETRILNARGAAWCADARALCEAAGVSPAVEVNAVSREQSIAIVSFAASERDPDAWARGLSLMLRLDDLACRRHGARMYHLGLYNAPGASRKFGPERLATLAREKCAQDPTGIFNPGKFLDLRAAAAPWVPGRLLRAGYNLLIALLKRPAAARALIRAARRLSPSPRPPADDSLFKTARECVNCGFCIPVCPAYLATRDERTTARGKLFLFQRRLEGLAPGSEEALLLQSCMHCGACTKVCQNALDLVPAWYDLEARVIAEAGRPAEAIEAFVKDVEASDDYKRLLRRGFITELKSAAIHEV